MRRMLFFSLIVFTLIACAAIRQAREDKKLSDLTPVAAGELSPAARADALANRIAPAAANLPYGAGVVAVPLLQFLLGSAGLGGWFFSWKRGRKLRLSGAIAPVATTTTEQPHVVDAALQHLADVRTGLFEAGPDGSGLKRGYKMALLALPVIHWLSTYLTGHSIGWIPSVGMSLVVGLLAGAEKWLSNLAPVAATNTTAPPTP